jgi:hypothetical protein
MRKINLFLAFDAESGKVVTFCATCRTYLKLKAQLWSNFSPKIAEKTHLVRLLFLCT